jgi:hypothetical protein
MRPARVSIFSCICDSQSRFIGTIWVIICIIGIIGTIWVIICIIGIIGTIWGEIWCQPTSLKHLRGEEAADSSLSWPLEPST